MQSTKILTDESMMELVSHGSSTFPFQYYYEDVGKFDNKCIDWHWHREFELVSVTEAVLPGRRTFFPLFQGCMAYAKIPVRPGSWKPISSFVRFGPVCLNTGWNLQPWKIRG